MFDSLLTAIDAQSMLDRVYAYLPNLAFALFLVAGFWLAYRLVHRMVLAALGRTRIAKQARSLVLRTVRIAMFVLATLTIADQLGFNVTALVAGVGIAGLALSFAAQDTLANFIAGVAIVIDKPFEEGDWISLGDLHATVREIRLRTTVLSTFDNETVVVPNKDLAQDRIVNYTIDPRIRVKVSLGIAYKEDVHRARETMLGTLREDDRILSEPAPDVIVTALGASSVDLQMRFWTEDPLLTFGLMWEYTERCKQALDQARIQIPFPHLQVLLGETEGLSRLAAAYRRA